jgi:hypothetical protein
VCYDISDGLIRLCGFDRYMNGRHGKALSPTRYDDANARLQLTQSSNTTKSKRTILRRS